MIEADPRKETGVGTDQDPTTRRERTEEAEEEEKEVAEVDQAPQEEVAEEQAAQVPAEVDEERATAQEMEDTQLMREVKVIKLERAYKKIN